MNSGNGLLKTSVVVGIGKIFAQIVTVLMFPIYTSALSPSQWGQIDFYLICTTLALPFITMQMDYAQFRFMVDTRGDEKKQHAIASTAFTYMMVIMVVICTVSVIVGCFVDIVNIQLVLLNALSLCLLNLAQQYAKGKSDYVCFAISGVVYGITIAIANILFLLVLKLGAGSVLLAYAAGNIASTIFIFCKCKWWKNISISLFDKAELRKMLRYSIPLIPNGVGWWIIELSDRIILTTMLSTTANGIYSIANKFPNIMLGAFQVIYLSWTEVVTAGIAKNNKVENISRTLNTLLRLLSSLCVVIIGWMWFVFPILIGNEFRESYIYVPMLMVAAVLNVMAAILGSIYTAQKETKKIGKASMKAAVINLAINLLFVKTIGIYAAAISTIAAFAFICISCYQDIRKKMCISFSARTILSVSAAFVISITLYYVDSPFANTANAIVSILLFVLMNKEIIKAIPSRLTALKNKVCGGNRAPAALIVNTNK